MSDTQPEPLVPQTAREALFAINVEVSGVHADSDVFEVAHRVGIIASEGLSRTTPINFELSDQLADRLADSHRVLKLVTEYLYGRLPEGDSVIESEVMTALVLPPDLEAMVERRIR
jgi:hypothetical protein